MARSMREFKVIQMLGKGSYGSVYKCLRKSDGNTYAVKEVNIRKLSSREREDAVNEIRVMASIEHPYIVRYRDAFVERDNLYIVMEYAEHGDVHRLIKKFKQANRYLKEDTVWSYLLQVCHALDHLHSKSILHRDIKPKNIFLAAKNHIRLGDLGCAKLMKTGLARTQIGTPYYMSPEIWSNKPYDDKSDMWAVGCFVYELCALEPPFLASDMKGLARKVRSSPTPKISRHYSSELRGLVMQLLDKSPKTRPSAAQVLRMAVARKREGLLPIAVPSASEEKKELLATIKMPAGMYGLQHRLALPGPAYSPAGPGAAGGGGGRVAKGKSAAARSPSPIVSPPKRVSGGEEKKKARDAAHYRRPVSVADRRRPSSAVPVSARGPEPGRHGGGGGGGVYAPMPVRKLDPAPSRRPAAYRPPSRGGRPASRYGALHHHRPAVPSRRGVGVPSVAPSYYARFGVAPPKAAGRRYY